MRISVLTDTLYSGGAQKVALDSALALARRGHEVSLFSEYDKKIAPAPYGVDIASIPFTKLWFKVRFNPPRGIRYLTAPFLGRAWDYALAFHKLQKNAPDIWNIHNIHGRRMPISFPFRLSLKRPVLWTFHDMWPVTGGCGFPLDSPGFTQDCSACVCDIIPSPGKKYAPSAALALRRKLWKSQHRITIVTPSEWLGREVGKSAVARHVRVEVIPNGIDTKVFTPMDKKAVRRELGIPADCVYVLILANRLGERRKGMNFASAIASALLKADKRIRIIYAGNQPEMSERDCSGRVYCFPYTKDPATVAKYYAASDFFLFTSTAENFPLTVLEAMACGAIVVAFACGGVPEEIIDGETGFINKAGDVEGSVAALLSLLGNIPLAQRIRHNARENVNSRFTIDRMAEEYEKLMGRLVAESRDDRR